MIKFLLPEKKLTSLLFTLVIALLAFEGKAQAPGATVVTPNTSVTHRTIVTITGTDLTNYTVRYNSVTTDVTKLSGSNATTITFAVPELTVSSGSSTPFTVYLRRNSVNYQVAALTYVKPSPTLPATSKVTKVITDWEGYWTSNSATTVKAQQPDRQHSVVGFEYGSTVYSTGVSDALLTSKGIGFTAADFRALPVNSISGTTPSSASASNYLVFASRMDGNATTMVTTAPEVAGRKVKDVLIDGIKGLGIGSGVTNMVTSAVLQFVVTDIAASRISDAEPDLLVSQVADPTSNDTDVYSFVDANGNIVGNPVTVILSNIPAIGTYKMDLYNMTFSTSYDNAVLTTGQTANGTRPIRLVGYKMSDFGITSANMDNIAAFKISPSGISDPAFIAYNANSMLIPAPKVTQQPASVVACTGTGTSTSFTVVATGNSLTYQWKKNGVNLTNTGNYSGTTTATLTVSNVSAADVATYVCEVSNPAGSIQSNPAYLNTIISVQPVANTACLNVSGPYLEVIANGLSLSYQWYDNGTTNSNTGGTPISGATSYRYTPPVTTLGTRYYYCVIDNSGQGCAREISNAAGFTVGATAVSGTQYIGGTAGTNNGITTTTICSGSTVVVRSAGHTTSGSPTYSWEQSADGVGGWNTVTGGSGGTTVNYTTPALTSTTYYRMKVVTSSCEVYGGILTINVTGASSAGTVSSNTTICNGATATLTTTGSVGTLQWQQSPDGTTNWTNVTGGAGATTASYTTAALTATSYYRVVATNGSCTAANSSAITVTVSPAVTAGTVSSNQSICVNNSTSVSVTGASGTIQWQQSVNGIDGWANVTGGSGATTATYTTPVLTGTTYYRAVITSGSCSANTSVITVTTNSPLAGTASGNVTICPNVGTTLTLSGYTGTIQWQQSANGTTGWSNVTGGTGATTESYTTAGATATTYYRALVTTGGCSVTSNTVTVTINNSFIWNGSVSNDWHTHANWSCNAIPTLTDDAIIPLTANQPVVSQNIMAYAKTLDVQTGAILTINTMRNITVQDGITVAATGNIVVSNKANLVQINAVANTGDIDVKRSSSALYRQDYTLWSTPVTGQKLFQFSPLTLANRFYTYSDADRLYVTVPGLSAASTTTFNTGVAYLIRMPNGLSNSVAPGYNAGTGSYTLNQTFRGVPNNGTVTMPVTHQWTVQSPVDASNYGYNGLGNPYPSTINIHSFIDTNMDNLETGTLYFWRKKNNDLNTSYTAINKTGYVENAAEGGNVGSGFVEGDEANWVINPGQGFIVQVKETATTVQFNNEMRRAVNNNQFFRSQPVILSRLWLNITSTAGAYGQTLVGYSDATSDGFDFGYDSPLFTDGIAALYTKGGGKDLSIQAKGTFVDTDVVPLHYRTSQAGEYTISLNKKDGLFANGQNVYLRDNQTNTIKDLNTGGYTFTAAEGVNESRFDVIYVTDGALGTTNPQLTGNAVIAYKNNGMLTVSAEGYELDNVKVFDIRGRLLFEKKAINSSTAILDSLATQEQMLILQVRTTDGATISKKVIF